MDIENVAFLAESHSHNSSDPRVASMVPEQRLLSPLGNHNSSSSGSQVRFPSKSALRKPFERDTSNLSSSASFSSTSQTMPSHVWSNQNSSSTSFESPRQLPTSTTDGMELAVSQSLHQPANCINNRAFEHPPFPLPSRRPGATSWWRSLLSFCIAEDNTERTIACADRVIYRPTANDEDQVMAAIPRSRVASRTGGLLSCCCLSSQRTRNFFIYLAMFLLLLLLTAALLETIHYFHSPCNDESPSSKSPFWLSHLLPSSLFSSGVEPSSSNSTFSPVPVTRPSSFHFTLPNDSQHATGETDLPYLDTQGLPFRWQDIRLPSFLQPISYQLFMVPSMVNFTNRGNVTIELAHTGGTPTDFLIFHSKKLNITKVTVDRIESDNETNNKHLTAMGVELIQECTRLEQVYVKLAQNMTAPFHYSLVIEFDRKLEDELEGFYISSYFNSLTKKKHYLLTTHFEPTLARTAFPCLDEPAMKANFSLKMLHDPAYQVFFNTDIVKKTQLTVDGFDRVLSISEPSVPMSTYLVAFVLCDFAVNTVHSLEGITIRTIVPEDQNNHTQYALEFASKVLSFFNQFFKVDYPLQKLDLVAVPDFGAGAMENWGIITFRTTTLLYNEAESSSEMQEQVATVIAHEIAHQWFGNLVTMDWWSELWLNEGFASYVENLGVDHIHPEWRMLDQFVISTTQQALSIDSLLTSHPIHTTVTNPAEIEAIFDLISYKKGSCLIRMIENFLGKENLQLGLEKYLNRYKYKTAKTTQLWESMSEVSASLPINVSTVMDTWITQQGYPVINARWAPDGEHLTVSQERFLSSLSPEEFAQHKVASNETFSQRWIVPLTLISDKAKNESELFWLESSSLNISLSRQTTNWFKLNYQQSGFYRVNYETSIWRDLIGKLVNVNPSEHFLSASDRAGLLDDAISLMRIGQLDVNTALDLTRYLEMGEHDYVPWETILNHFGIIDTLMLQHPSLHRYILRLMNSMISQLGWLERTGDGMFEKKLRAILLRSAVFYGDQTSIDRARAIFTPWIVDQTKVPANIRDIVYHAGIQFGSDLEWNHVWATYLNASDASEKRLLLGALGSTRNHYLLSTYLSASLNKSLVRTQDTPFVIQNVARNPIGRTMAWTFVKQNWNKIVTVFGQGSFSIDAIVSETTWHFFTEYDLSDVEQFFSHVSVGSGRQAIRQSLEKIRANIYWKEHIESKVIRWLRSPR